MPTRIPTLNELLHKFEYKISGGGDYLWQCFGRNAWALDFADDVSIVIDTQNQTVFSLNYYEPSEGSIVVHTWVNPLFKDAYVFECNARNIDDEEFIEDIDEMLAIIDE